MTHRKISSLIVVVCLSIASAASACPSIHNLQDVNCDGKFKIAVIGDSIGRGSRGNLRAAGSFVKRIGSAFRFATIKNLSIPGLDTPHAIKNITQEFPENEYKVKKSLLDNSDFILIELGLNDYFSTDDPKEIVTRLSTLVELVNDYMETHGGPAVLAVSLITPVRGVTPSRAEQALFIKSLNKKLITNRSPVLPAYVEFNQLGASDVSIDGIHPNTVGHDKMKKILVKYIKTALDPALFVPTATPSPLPTETPISPPTEIPAS